MNKNLFKKRNSLFIAFLLLLNGCMSDHEIDYYETGTVKSTYSIVNGIKNGIGIKYYDNSIIKYLCNYKDGKLNGIALSYDSTGNLDKIQTWKDGSLNGPFQIFYSDGSIKEKYYVKDGIVEGEYLMFYPNGKIKERKEYIVRNEKSELNQYLSYNLKSDIEVEKSNYFTLFSKKDTINLNENYELKIILNAPVFKYMRVLVGDYCEDFEILEKDSLKNIINGNDNLIAYLTIKPKHKGLNKFSAIIDNYDYTNNDDNTDKKYKSRYMYFSKSFFVQ